MYYYFRVVFKDPDADIYVVRVETKIIDGNSEHEAKEVARANIKETILNTCDFEINRLTLQDLISQFHFIDDIAQLEIIKHP